MVRHGATHADTEVPNVPLPQQHPAHLELVGDSRDVAETPSDHVDDHFPRLGDTSFLTTAGRHRLAAYIHTKLAELAEMP
ncbi:hypothetical protein [Nocardia rhizosphaerihabitans]|uniref:Uncharacterized protein n=1 Tax=Nocardia rhizosphaerihabitans TaxID=1691570 RepID=A0ABQ2KFU5_9NOCA|nr:hypothetical protein [Nocardia rhizosphaerihabitans]GGN81301.1 hypothetical protein GCM10011610_31590 [Nocardia rhizosphaerihabitans]